MEGSSPDEILARRVEQLANLSIRHLAGLDVRAPLSGEVEPEFSAAVLSPPMISFVRSLQVSGLHVGGDGAGPVASTAFLGRSLRPDITILSHTLRLIAFEVKYIRPSSVSSDIAKAVGQATLYRAFGFERSVIVLVDLERVLDREDVLSARPKLRNVGVELIVRQRVRNRLALDADVSG